MQNIIKALRSPFVSHSYFEPESYTNAKFKFIKCNEIDFDSISDILISFQIRIHFTFQKLNGQEGIIAQNNRLPMIVLQISLKLVKMEHFMILLPDHVVSLW